MKKLSKEHIGELLMLGEILTWSFFPIIIKSTDNFLPPILLVAFTSLISGVIAFFWLLKKGKIKDMFNKKALLYMIPAATLIAVVLFPLVTLFGQHSASGSTALLLQGEVLFTFLFFGLLGVEKISIKRCVGGFLVLLGAIFVMLKDFTGQVNIWDLAIFIITAVAPLANYFQKKIVQIVDPLAQIAFRNLFGGVILLIIGFLIEDFVISDFISKKAILLILLNGIFIYTIRVVFFLEAIKRIDVSKAIAINGVTPAISLFLSYLILNEKISVSQMISFVLVFLGVFFLTRKDEKRLVANK